MLAQLALGATMPSHVIRQVLEAAPPFDEAVERLASRRLTTETYFSVAGVAPGQGTVLTRGRLRCADRWPLGAPPAEREPPPQPAWFRLQTNYDRWLRPPPASDGGRAAQGAAHMRAYCAGGGRSHRS